MVAAYSQDLRIRVIKVINEGASCRSVAKRFGVSPSTAIRWHERYRRTGHVMADRIGGDRKTHHIEAHAAVILNWIDEQVDITIPEIRARLTKRGTPFSHGAVWRLLDRHHYTRKKRQRMPASKTGLT